MNGISTLMKELPGPFLHVIDREKMAVYELGSQPSADPPICWCLDLGLPSLSVVLLQQPEWTKTQTYIKVTKINQSIAANQSTRLPESYILLYTKLDYSSLSLCISDLFLLPSLSSAFHKQCNLTLKIISSSNFQAFLRFCYLYQ